MLYAKLNDLVGFVYLKMVLKAATAVILKYT